MQRPQIVVGVALVYAMMLAPNGGRAAAVRISSPPSARVPANPSSGWPQFGFNAAHTWFNPNETTISPDNVGQLTLAWTFSPAPESLAIAIGRIGNVVEVNGVVYAPSSSGEIYALNAANGDLLWRAPTGVGYSSSGSAPAVDDGMLFTVCNLGAQVQGICALNAASGAQVWSFSVPGITSESEAPPVVANGTVYFGGCGAKCAYVALNEKTGRVVWSTPEPVDCAMNNGVPPTIYEGKLFASIYSCSGAAVVALNAKTGGLVWQLAIGQVFLGAAAGGGRICTTFVYPGATEYAAKTLSASNGVVDWASGGDSGRSSPSSAPSIAYERCYAPIQGGIYGFRLKGIKVHVLYANNAIATPSLTFANSIMFVLNRGVPLAQGALRGGILWTASTRASSAVPIVADGQLIGACNSTMVCAWGLPTGARRTKRV